jgi:hypothetical protein
VVLIVISCSLVLFLFGFWILLSAVFYSVLISTHITLVGKDVLPQPNNFGLLLFHNVYFLGAYYSNFVFIY